MDREELFAGFESVAFRHVPMTARRWRWIRIRRMARWLGWGRLYWYCSRKIWRA